MIDAIWKNIHGAWVIAGTIGIRQYYGYTKRDAVSRYKDEARNAIFANQP